MVSRIIEFCARNRLVVLFGVAIATLAAIWSISRTKLDAIPDLSDPQVIVFTEWMGRSPTLVEDQVTYPIVSALISAPQVADVRGYSMFGMSFVYVIFEEGTDMYWARSRVLEYLGTHPRAPAPRAWRPTLGPDATGIGWVFQYTLVDKSGQHGLDELRTFQDFTLRYALGSVPGVAEVASVGGYQKQYQVTVDPNRLRAYGVTPRRRGRAPSATPTTTSAAASSRCPAASTTCAAAATSRTSARSTSTVGARPAAPPACRCCCATSARCASARTSGAALLDWNGEGEAVGGIVVMRYGENALDVIERVKKRLEELQPGLPAGRRPPRWPTTAPSSSTAPSTRSSDALLEEALVVAAGDHPLPAPPAQRAAARSSRCPIAVALAFIPMYLLDIPATIMSLGGIAIAIGATVDAEIVMIEAVAQEARARAARRRPAQAARRGRPRGDARPSSSRCSSSRWPSCRSSR